MVIRFARDLVPKRMFDMTMQCHSLSIMKFNNFLSNQRVWLQHNRSMATSKRVQDRSKLKRVHDLEVVTEKWKISSKILFLMETLKKQPEHIVPLKLLDQYRRQINLPRPHKIVDFLRKSPKLFELYKDQRGTLWCGMTKEAESLVQEEEKIIEGHADKAAEYVTRLLMMSIDKCLTLDKISQFRKDIGLPHDFRNNWIRKYPQHFKVVRDENDIEYLELVSWNPDWAITELEKKTLGDDEVASHTPGMLSLSFPMKFPPDCKKIYRYGGKIDHFQKRAYLSPYADARGLEPGSLEFDKRAIAIMHEILSFSIDKRLATDQLTYFRFEFVMPQKLMRLLLKQFGIFYVSERGKRFSVFLTEAYNGSELIHKNPFVLWRQKVQSLIGYRGKKKKIETFSDLSDLYSSDCDEKNMPAELDQEEIMDGLDGASGGD